MSLLANIQSEMTTALKAGDGARLSALRMIKAALERRAKDSGKPLDEQAEQQVLATQVKQRRDSIEMFRKGDRPELAAKEEAELLIVESYMPKEASVIEIDEAIRTSIQDLTTGDNVGVTPGSISKKMGLIIKLAKDKLAGRRVDGKLLSERVKSAIEGK